MVISQLSAGLLLALFCFASITEADAFLGGDIVTIHPKNQLVVNSGILDIPQEIFHETAGYKRYLIFGSGTPDILGNAQIRSVNSDSGFFVIATASEHDIPLLERQGYTIIPDFRLDLHEENSTSMISDNSTSMILDNSTSALSDNATRDASRIADIASSHISSEQFGYTGKGIKIAVIDTGVDFSNPDMRHSVARDHNNIPIMLDADGQGIILTNATFAANIDEYGVLTNFTGPPPENMTSTVYKNSDGVFLDIVQGGQGTIISVYNSFFPQNGQEPVFNGTLNDDMKIGKDHRDYIKSQSGIYRLGVMYQGAPAGQIPAAQVVPVLLVDSYTPGSYDTIIPDLSTAWEDFTKAYLPADQPPDYDFDFTDEKPIVLGSGNEFLVYDHDEDGSPDFSAGTVGARIVDVYGVTASEKSLIDPIISAVNGTLLPPIDPDGEFFGVMTDFMGHGTSSASSIASRGIEEYDIYNNTEKYVIRGAAPDVSIVPVKALWFGDSVYASLWAAGFDNKNSTWEFSGAPRVDIMSNSWGVSNFPTLGAAPGLDLLSLIQSALATPRSLDRDYPGVLIVTSAGNSGHGYGTMGMPNSAPFAISVGATTNNVYVGYGPFAGQPRFGNTTNHANHVIDFSSRGPGVIGDPKPDLMSIGAHGFAPMQVTNPEKETRQDPFSLFGGTSMAAPVVSGAAAILMQSMQENNQNYDPFRIKNILVSSATDIQNDPFTQGAGLVNVDDAVRFVHGDPGYFTVHNDASYSNLKKILDVSMGAANHTAFGVDRFMLPAKEFPQSAWFAGHLLAGQRSHATFTIENPSSEPLLVAIEPQHLQLVHKTEFEGTTILQQQDSILNETGVYVPNYIRLTDVRPHDTLESFFDDSSQIPDDASLMVLTANFGFSEFMNKTDPMYANDMKIASLYLYDWTDKNNDTYVSSDELSMVNRAGSWGTVQEMRVSDPGNTFEGIPLVGMYPVPARYSYWTGDIQQNATSFDYTLGASYYKKAKWDDVWLNKHTVEIPPKDTAKISASVIVPAHYQTGVYQGFIKFESDAHSASIPVSFGVREEITENDSVVLVRGESDGDIMYGTGYIKGAFDMTNRYMAGDWRQFYFDIQNTSINTGILDVSWEDPDTNLAVFAIDPRGHLIHSNVQPGAFGHFTGWPSSDWLGSTQFSQGGGFFPVKNKDSTSSGLYVPINQTGVYTVMAHSGLFGGNDTTEEISITAKFTNLPEQKKPEISPESAIDLPIENPVGLSADRNLAQQSMLLP